MSVCELLTALLALELALPHKPLKLQYVKTQDIVSKVFDDTPFVVLTLREPGYDTFVL